MALDTIIIRLARPSDLDEIIRLCAAHAEYEQADYDPAGKRKRLGPLLFGPSPRLFCLVAERAGALVGYATWSERSRRGTLGSTRTWTACVSTPRRGGVGRAAGSWYR